MERRVARTCVISGGVRKLHSTYPDGMEIVEEFNIQTHELLTRKVKKISEIGEGKWEWEVGEPTATFNPENELMRASSNNPVFIRKDTITEFQWRVRNLPYPPEVYSVTGESSTGKITIRTSNKKYFKVFTVPDLIRNHIPLNPELIRWGHEFNTLIISYSKPLQILEIENDMKRQLEQARKTRGNKKPEEGDVECIHQ
ncbi:hypothetical protein SteCoe_13361 [Stentor coeruleus]|uniref:Protein DPCD n=1 Tax=Stentor coeruleus TaxID=5963 RepID=A0A1R2C8I6_9CILI|nr:hypothetical protein SteCoe_13361 [Stentor coeruleus]